MFSDPLSGLTALFAGAFLSATLLPGGSEALLAALAIQGSHPPPLLLAAATVGNTLGGMSSWLLGRLLARRADAVFAERHRRALHYLRRWGGPALLLSWVPIIGDPLCLAAGWLRVRWLNALLFITAGKGARYATVLWLAQPVSGSPAP